MDLDDIRGRGVSRGPLGFLTNRLRAALWRLLLPYFERMAALSGANNELVRTHEWRLAEIDARVEEAGTAPGVLIERVTTRVGGIQKDVLATGHRLASIEDQLAALQASVDALRRQLAGHDTPAG